MDIHADNIILPVVDIHSNFGRVPDGYARAIMCTVKDTHTPHRPIRVEAELWDEFGRLAGERGRAEVIRAFIAWYVRRRGARLPERPPRPAD